MQETQVQSLGWEDPLEEEMVTHCSILAWRIPTDRGDWRGPWGHRESDRTEATWPPRSSGCTNESHRQGGYEQWSSFLTVPGAGDPRSRESPDAISWLTDGLFSLWQGQGPSMGLFRKRFMGLVNPTHKGWERLKAKGEKGGRG